MNLHLLLNKRSVKYAKKLLVTDNHTENYELPTSIKFPRPMRKEMCAGIEAFVSPSDGKNDITLLYFHGGAYVHPFYEHQLKFLVELSEDIGCEIVAPNYLMLPKWRAKTSNKITIDFYESFIKTHDMNKVVMIGDSAGGGLASIIIQDAIKKRLPLPKKVILLSPWVDVTGGNPKRKDYMLDHGAALILGEAWQEGYQDKDPHVSPLYGDMRGFPSTDLWVGGYEILYDDVISFYDKLRLAGVYVSLHYEEKEGHVFPIYPTKKGQKARKEIIESIKAI